MKTVLKTILFGPKRSAEKPKGVAFVGAEKVPKTEDTGKTLTKEEFLNILEGFVEELNSLALSYDQFIERVESIKSDLEDVKFNVFGKEKDETKIEEEEDEEKLRQKRIIELTKTPRQRNEVKVQFEEKILQSKEGKVYQSIKRQAMMIIGITASGENKLMFDDIMERLSRKIIDAELKKNEFLSSLSELESLVTKFKSDLACNAVLIDSTEKMKKDKRTPQNKIDEIIMKYYEYRIKEELLWFDLVTIVSEKYKVNAFTPEEYESLRMSIRDIGVIYENEYSKFSKKIYGVHHQGTPKDIFLAKTIRDENNAWIGLAIRTPVKEDDVSVEVAQRGNEVLILVDESMKNVEIDVEKKQKQIEILQEILQFSKELHRTLVSTPSEKNLDEWKKRVAIIQKVSEEYPGDIQMISLTNDFSRDVQNVIDFLKKKLIPMVKQTNAKLTAKLAELENEISMFKYNLAEARRQLYLIRTTKKKSYGPLAANEQEMKILFAWVKLLNTLKDTYSFSGVDSKLEFFEKQFDIKGKLELNLEDKGSMSERQKKRFTLLFSGKSLQPLGKVSALSEFDEQNLLEPSIDIEQSEGESGNEGFTEEERKKEEDAQSLFIVPDEEEVQMYPDEGFEEERVETEEEEEEEDEEISENLPMDEEKESLEKPVDEYDEIVKHNKSLKGKLEEIRELENIAGTLKSYPMALSAINYRAAVSEFMSKPEYERRTMTEEEKSLEIELILRRINAESPEDYEFRLRGIEIKKPPPKEVHVKKTALETTQNMQLGKMTAQQIVKRSEEIRISEQLIQEEKKTRESELLQPVSAVVKRKPTVVKQLLDDL